MDILKIYVQDSEYFPTVQEVIQFRNEFWESKLFESRVEDSNVFSFLRPEGVIAMRLSNPALTKSFDRVPRRSPGEVITSQSTGKKFSTYDFRKLGNLLVGDVMELGPGNIRMAGYADTVSCKIFFQITEFYIQGTEYQVKGTYFFHSSLPEMNYLRDIVNDNNCLIKIMNRQGDIKFQELKFEHSKFEWEKRILLCAK